jgi:hypothetical protein
MDATLQPARRILACRCSGYRGIPVHLLLGLFNGPASAQGATTTEVVVEEPREEVPHEENDD